MTLKGKFVRQDVFTGRTRLGPLGWILVLVATLFVFACVVGSYQLLTRNVTRLSDSPSRETPQVFAATTPTEAAIRQATLPTVIPGAARPITWTVWAAQDPLGQPIYEGTPEVKAWVLRDYRVAQEWLNGHLLEKDYLLQHLGEYFTGKALADGRQNIQHAFEESFVIMAPPIAQPRQRPPLDQPRWVTFTQDGRQARLNDYTDAGPAKQYDTRTRKPMQVSLKNGLVWQYLMEYDSVAKRWKIARNTQVINVETSELVWSDEP
jgi:hypothetical protein